MMNCVCGVGRTTHKIKVQAVCARHEVEEKVRGREVSIIIASLHVEKSIAGEGQALVHEFQYFMAHAFACEF